MASLTPTVCLEVISLVASSCGYYRGQIEQRAALIRGALGDTERARETYTTPPSAARSARCVHAGASLQTSTAAPEALPRLNGAFPVCVGGDGRKEQHVALALMIPLVMIMCHILRQRMAERRFPKQDQPCKTLLLDRPHPALRVGVQIRRSRRQRD